MVPVRIAILDCDPLTPKLRLKYGSYGDVIVKWLNDGAQSLGLALDTFETTIWDVMGRSEFPDFSTVDAVVITGSRAGAYEDIPWVRDLIDSIKMLLDQGRAKIAGLCFGHQVIARALNIKVIKSSWGWEVGACPVNLSPCGKGLFGTEKLEIHQMHKDIVVSYPKDVEALGSSPLCEVQGMYVPNRLLSLQGHPEFGEDVMLELLDARSDLGLQEDEMFEHTLRRASKSHDGILIAQVFLKFLLSK